MNAQEPQIQIIYKYLNLLLSRHKLIIVMLLLAVTAGYAYYLRTPQIYQSSASIIYQEQRINPSRLSPDEKVQIGEMVNTIAQQVLSRTNLEKIIEEFNLYAEMRENAAKEDIIERLRKNAIDIDLGRKTGNVFTISFRGKNPNTVRQVTNALAAKFIEENIRVREERARERASYIQEELRMSKVTLHEKESQMRDYKLKYYNEMRDQRASNVTRLNTLQSQFQAIQTNIQGLEQTRLLASEQLEVRKNLQKAAFNADVAVPETKAGLLQTELANARNSRNELLARYTKQHPSVRRIEKRIENLESEISNFKDPDSKEAVSVMEAVDPRIQELSIQLKEIDLDLKNLRKESENILSQIKTYQKWIDASPIREAEWSDLTRDYDELKRYHDALVAQSLAAEAAESLEIRQKGSQFKIVDPAYLPETPVKGSFLKILISSMAIGLAVGAVLVLGIDFLDPSFKNQKEMEDYLQIPVTCTLPLIFTDFELKRQKIKNILWYLFFAIWVLALITATLYFWSTGALIFA